MYYIILHFSSSVPTFISLAEAKFLCDHFIGQYNLLIYSTESTVKKQKGDTTPFR